MRQYISSVDVKSPMLKLVVYHAIRLAWLQSETDVIFAKLEERLEMYSNVIENSLCPKAGSSKSITISCTWVSH